MNPVVSTFFYNMATYATCITLCSLGGQMTLLSGRFNIGMEGLMLFGSFFSLYFTNLFGSLILGILMGAFISGLLGLFMAFMNTRVKVDIYIVGMAINMLGTGLTTFMVYLLTGSQSSVIFSTAPKLANVEVPIINSIPYVNQVFSNHNMLDYLSILLCVLMFVVIRKTRFGRHLQAVGLDEGIAAIRGISVTRYLSYSYFLCGVFCGLAGASLSLPMSIYVGGMVGITNGRGWLAMAVVILAGNNPLVVLAASFLIGGLSALGALLQSMGNYPLDLVFMLPFAGALLASLIYSKAGAKRK